MPRPHRFRFSMRQGAILVTLACVACAAVIEYIDYRERQRVAEFVKRALEPRRYASTETLTGHSRSDWGGRRPRELLRYDDRQRLVAELLRLLHDPHWQSDHRGEAVRALAMLSEMPGVVEEMLALIDRPHLRTIQLTAIYELRNVKREHQLVIDRLLELRRSDRERVRQNAYSALEAIAYRHREFADAISAVLIEALDDPSEQIRYRAAGTLGGLPRPELAAALTAALDDESDLVRLGAARSLRSISGDSELLMRVASEVLLSGVAFAEAKRQAVSALREFDEIPPATVDALRDYAAAAADAVPFPRRASESFHLGMDARRLLWQKGLDETADVAAQGE
jgi:HEAT repeat protein